MSTESRFELINSDCLAAMLFMEDNSVDSIVTDPPYGLSFMGKEWDHGVPSVAIWREALRVLKPGGHLLSFGGSRTYHRMASAIEDAGFEIRDQIMWVYGSGFPKSLDVGKAIDKAAGAERAVVGFDAAKASQQTRAVGTTAYGDYAGNAGEITAPSTDAAKQWDGWGTALKPAHEPIVVARKPLIGTCATNVLAHGTGALNIDGCRVQTDEPLGRFNNARTEGSSYVVQREAGLIDNSGGLGRWPANLIHDGSDEVLAAFPDAKGQLADVSATAPSAKTSNVYGAMRREGEASRGSDNEGAVGFKMKPGARRLDAGSAARFFYCAKASKSDRNEGCEELPAKLAGCMNMRNDAHAVANGLTYAHKTNTHPTVKPTDLMAYLCRLVTPPGGIVLDPFMGSGSTGKAALREGFRFIGIEKSPEYMAIAEARVK